MTRNTVRRVEVAAPVHDDNARKKIRHIFNTIMIDDEKGKEQRYDGVYVDRKINSIPVDSQAQFFNEHIRILKKELSKQPHLINIK